MTAERTLLIDVALGRIPHYLRDTAGLIFGGHSRADLCQGDTPVDIIILAARALQEALTAAIVECWPEIVIAPSDARALLTPRECQIARLVAIGGGAQAIAAECGCSVRTVGNHRASIMRKIGGHNTADITRWAIAHGLARATE